MMNHYEYGGTAALDDGGDWLDEVDVKESRRLESPTLCIVDKR